METMTVPLPSSSAPAVETAAVAAKVALRCTHCPWKRTIAATDRRPERCPTCGTRLLG